MFAEGFGTESEIPIFHAWQERMMEESGVKKIVEEKRVAIKTLEDSAVEAKGR